MTEKEMNHLEAAFEVLGRALGKQASINREQLAHDIRASIPHGTTPNIAYVLCTSMAAAVLSDEPIQTAKKQWPSRAKEAHR